MTTMKKSLYRKIMNNWTLATSKRIKWHGVVAAPSKPVEVNVSGSPYDTVGGGWRLSKKRLHYAKSQEVRTSQGLKYV